MGWIADRIMGRMTSGKENIHQPQSGGRRYTPTKYEIGHNANREDHGPLYPNFGFIHDSTNQGSEGVTVVGNESTTWQGNAGSFMQLRTDGSIQIRACDSMYTLTFGANRMTITGAHDVTVQGDGSMCVEGDYNMTCRGDANFAIQGNMNMTAAQCNFLVGNGFDVMAQSSAMRTQTGLEVTSEGNYSVHAKGNICQVARGGSFSVRAGNGIQMAALNNCAITAQNGQMDFLAMMDVNVDGKNVFINSGKATAASHRDLASLAAPAEAKTSGLAPGDIISTSTWGGGGSFI